MIPIVIYGLAEQSSVTWHYLTHSDRFRFVADGDTVREVMEFETIQINMRLEKQ